MLRWFNSLNQLASVEVSTLYASDQDRDRQNGITLFETLLALSVLALFAVPLFALFERSATALANNQTNIQQAEFAHALLNEIEVTGSFQSRTEIYRGRYDIEIEVTVVPLPIENRFHEIFELYEITMAVDDRHSSSPPYVVEATLLGSTE